MRRVQIALLVLTTAAVSVPFGAWLAGQQQEPLAKVPESTEMHAQYQCPMHPAVVRDEPGDCPICGMKLVKMEGPAPKARQPRFYRSPMNPAQTSAVPAKDSMGMEYVPVYDDEVPARSEVEGLASIEIDASRQQLIGLRTAVVDTGVIGGAFRTVGRVSVDETQVRRISLKVPGYVEQIFVDFVGKPVRKGQPLFSLYSPDVLGAENELLAARRGQQPTLAASARRRLELWDVPESELERLEREGIAAKNVIFVSPANGVVTKKDIVEGARLEAGSMPYEVVDLSTLWVLADVYETELRFVAAGMQATLSLNAYPGRRYSGKVLFVDPLLDPRSRTARVRLAFPNRSGELKPEMFGEVVLERPAREVLRVPSDALISSGTDEVVFVARDDGRFEPRRVKVGERARDYTEVLEGLSDGEAVVTRANFLVDSESRLRASLARISSDTATTSAHAGHAP